MQYCGNYSCFSGHKLEEDVLVSVLDFQGIQTTASVLAKACLTYQKDSALYLAEFLRDSVFHLGSLDDLELIKGENFNLGDEELSTLDRRLSRALSYISLPDWWSLLGDEANPGESGYHEIGLQLIMRYDYRCGR